MLLNYHIGFIVLGLLCVGVRVRFGWVGIRIAGFSKQRTKSAIVVVQQHRHILLKMGILMLETC